MPVHNGRNPDDPETAVTVPQSGPAGQVSHASRPHDMRHSGRHTDRPSIAELCVMNLQARLRGQAGHASARAVVQFRL